MHTRRVGEKLPYYLLAVWGAGTTTGCVYKSRPGAGDAPLGCGCTYITMSTSQNSSLGAAGFGSFVCMFIVVFLVFGLISRGDGSGGGVLSRLHPVAIERATGYADKADSVSSGGVGDVDVSRAIGGDPGVAIVDNLDRIPGWPRVVQYNVEELGVWSRVCVDIPNNKTDAPYAVICPGSASQ